MWYILPAMAVTNIKQVIQDLIIPEFRTLSAEIKRLDEKIETGLKRVDEKIESIRSEFEEKFKRLDVKIDNLDKRLSSEINLLKEEIKFLREELKIAIDIHERLGYLEAKIGK